MGCCVAWKRGWVQSWEPLACCSSGSAVAQLCDPWRQTTAQLLTRRNRKKWYFFCLNYSAISGWKVLPKDTIPAGTRLTACASGSQSSAIDLRWLWVTADESFSACCVILSSTHIVTPPKCFLLTAYIHSNQIMGWGEKAIEIRSVETGHLDGVFMHKRAQRLKFLCERNDKVSPLQNLCPCFKLQATFRL